MKTLYLPVKDLSLVQAVLAREPTSYESSCLDINRAEGKRRNYLLDCECFGCKDCALYTTNWKTDEEIQVKPYEEFNDG